MQKQISIAAELPHLFIVDKGLSENDTILLEGIRMVKNKEKIKTEMVNPTEVLSHLELYAE